MADDWATDTLRDDVRQAVDTVLAGEVRDGAMKLWNLGFSTSDLGFAGGLWQIWGRIDGTDAAYVGFLGDDGYESVRRAYPPATLERLALVKRRYDPDNLFHRNLNVHPAVN